MTIGPVLQLTDAIKQYVEEKVGNAVHNHGPLVKEVDVRMSVRGAETGRGAKLQRCEVGQLWNILLQIKWTNALGDCQSMPLLLEMPKCRNLEIVDVKGKTFRTILGDEDYFLFTRLFVLVDGSFDSLSWNI